jgi:hypothetical protein
MRRTSVCFGLASLTVLGLLAGAPGSASAHQGDYLLVWAGDWNASDATTSGAADPERLAAMAASGGAPGPDFLAVIDADPNSPSYGRVVNTVTVPGVENEPHHMQYVWAPGDRVYAGALFGDATFVFDVSNLPAVELVATVGPLDTPCGSVPDAYWVLSDGTALGTYMGGPNAAGDPRCNGGDSNGFAGTPGELVRISPDGEVLGEFSAAGVVGAPHEADIRPNRCASVPPLVTPSCANPHGIQAREDLGIAITSDYAEPRNVPVHPANAPDNRIFRDTVRVWDISDLDAISLRSVSVMPRTGLSAAPPLRADPRGFMGIMETTVTNLPGHKGAFASSMCGGAIFYTADVTAADPFWTQVVDLTSVIRDADPSAGRHDGCAGAGWLQVSPDDTMLFQAVIGRAPGTLGPGDAGVPKMVYALDIRDLVAVAPEDWAPGNPLVCSVETAAEVLNGGSEASCPSVVGRQLFDDRTSGGPHWGSIDAAGATDGTGRLTSVRRIATSNYFVARSGTDGDHTVCMVTVSPTGALSVDTTFRDELTRTPCVGFDRASWPHGTFGPAKPHAVLFARAG